MPAMRYTDHTAAEQGSVVPAGGNGDLHAPPSSSREDEEATVAVLPVDHEQNISSTRSTAYHSSTADTRTSVRPTPHHVPDTLDRGSVSADGPWDDGVLAAHTPALDLSPSMSVNPARAIEEHLQSSTESIRSPNDLAFTPFLRDHHRARDREPETGIASTTRPSRDPLTMATMDNALPENDGMQSLREKLQEIKMLAVSMEEKAQRMHFLMMQDYLKHKSNEGLPDAMHTMDVDEPASPILGAAVYPIDPTNPYNIRPGDLEPVFSPLPKTSPSAETEAGEAGEAVDVDEKELGCMHYKRNVKIQCFDCQRWFPCRHCHDQSKDLQFVHSLQRKKTQNMLCMLCKTPQPAAEVCINCGEYAAWYYCPKCKLWDNDSNKRIYHCDDCGICRVGEGLGKDYVHCRRCNVCISISTSAAHPCVERATEGNCPLCLVELFESRTAVVSLPCGHYMHGDCYKDLMAVTYKCPVCSKSAVNMELQWRKLDDEIAVQPMPEDDEDLHGVLPHIEDGSNAPDPASTTTSQPCRPRQVWVGCTDCGSRSWTPFHWLGLKCQRCDSYNTNQMPPTTFNETETERLLRQQQVHRHDFTGNSVLRDAGIGMIEPEEVPGSTLEVPKSPSQQPTSQPSSPRLPSGAQSPGRYFVLNEPSRRPSFTTTRFTAPSMPTLSNLPDMPRMPRMPNLPNLPNFRQNFPNMPNVELSRFSPYEMIDAVSRGLSPMRYYLRGLDAREDEEMDARIAARPTSAQSDPTRRPTGSKLRTSSSGSAAVESVDLWATDEGDDDGDSDSIHALEPVDDSSSGDEDLSDEDMPDNEVDVDDDRRGEWELLGHR